MESRIILVNIEEASVTTDVTPEQMTEILKVYPRVSCRVIEKKPDEYTYSIGKISRRNFDQLLSAIQANQSFNLSSRQAERVRKSHERCRQSTERLRASTRVAANATYESRVNFSAVMGGNLYIEILRVCDSDHEAAEVFTTALIDELKEAKKDEKLLLAERTLEMIQIVKKDL